MLQPSCSEFSSTADGEAVPTGVRSARPLSSLWAGYGTITEVETDDEPSQLLIVKEVAPPPGSGVSHARKMRSYQIEAAFYQRVAPHLPPGAACHVPHCLGVHSTLDADSSSDAGGMQLVMSDLRQRFPNRCEVLGGLWWGGGCMEAPLLLPA